MRRMRLSRQRQCVRASGEIASCRRLGLVIDYLNGEPGVYSARYMGENTSYHIKNANLIERLQGVPDEQRTARFACVIAAAFPDGTVKPCMEPWRDALAMKKRGRMVWI